MSRDFGYYWLRLVIYVLVTVCIGTIYLNVGTGYNSIMARGACASFVFGFVTFMSIGGFPSFVEDMKGQYQNDLRGLMFDNQTPDLPQIPGEYVLEYVFQITVTRSKWINLSVIFSMIIVYRIIFFLTIKINEDLTPCVRGYLARKRMKQKNGGQNSPVAPYGLTQSPSLRTYVADKR
ncbi:hypothetical protein L1987_15286 [Smallanthus sonchifolius]|uniref:Uncharacterized protein n=1 Tax=Smallanthus sonchifolius TaxID=185202 RepID=A0ACB9J7D2_9ASTR|nr:hypothetical protein L1987_15286 [Smallanthus sonchifolius]